MTRVISGISMFCWRCNNATWKPDEKQFQSFKYLGFIEVLLHSRCQFVAISLVSTCSLDVRLEEWIKGVRDEGKDRFVRISLFESKKMILLQQLKLKCEILRVPTHSIAVSWSGIVLSASMIVPFLMKTTDELFSVLKETSLKILNVSAVDSFSSPVSASPDWSEMLMITVEISNHYLLFWSVEWLKRWSVDHWRTWPKSRNHSTTWIADLVDEEDPKELMKNGPDGTQHPP